jgi:ubiquinone/menaquinone biosynthesis C-methylase UbiE
MRRGESYETGTRRKYRDDQVAARYDREFTKFSLNPNDIFVRMVTRRERRAIAEALQRIGDSARSVIDVPCGTGKLASILHERGYAPVMVDLSLEMMRIARQLPASERAAFAQADATQLPFESGTFDVAICLRLLHRVPDDVKSSMLNELHRVSRRYAIVSYGVASPWHRVRGLLRKLLTGRTTVPFAVSAAAMSAMLSGVGWSLRETWAMIPVASAEHVMLLEKSSVD